MVCIQIRADILLVLNWVQTIFANVKSADKEREGRLGNNEYKSDYIEMKDVKLITR